ncbi:MAG TPA: FUN14 domain-containing protein [Nitrososphaeraceae archaeon]|jgi:uncharacterized membrane protein (Fun14 family)|nr:FUN14 domain-containing protein [Nitrososphaeraceae archaeon]
MSVDLGSLASSATPIAVGGIAGFLAGYAIKKVIKIVLVIAGLMIVAYVALGYQNYVSVDWSKIEEAGSGLISNVSNTNLPGTEQSISSSIAAFGIPLVGSLAGGFILGFIKG